MKEGAVSQAVSLADTAKKVSADSSIAAGKVKKEKHTIVSDVEQNNQNKNKNISSKTSTVTDDKKKKEKEHTINITKNEIGASNGNIERRVVGGVKFKEDDNNKNKVSDSSSVSISHYSGPSSNNGPDRSSSTDPSFASINKEKDNIKEKQKENISQNNVPGWCKADREKVQGGNIHGALSNHNIDNCIAQLIPSYIPSREIYDYRTELNPTVQQELGASIRMKISQRLHKYGYVLLPVHVRYHWTAAIIVGQRISEATAIIYDSARSKVTKADIHTIFKKLGLPEPTIHSIGKQPRGTDQCGLHVILVAYIIDDLKTQKIPTLKPRILDLDSWRKLLEESGEHTVTWSKGLKNELENSAPAITSLIHRLRNEVSTNQVAGGMVTRGLKWCSECNKSVTKEEFGKTACKKCEEDEENNLLAAVQPSSGKKKCGEEGCERYTQDNKKWCKSCYTSVRVPLREQQQQHQARAAFEQVAGNKFYGRVTVDPVSDPTGNQSPTAPNATGTDDLKKIPLSRQEVLPNGHRFSRQLCNDIERAFAHQEMVQRANASSNRPRAPEITYDKLQASDSLCRVLVNEEFREHLLQAARVKLGIDKQQLRRQVWQCIEPGQMLSVDVMDEVTALINEQARRAGGNTEVLNAGDVLLSTQNGNHSGISKQLKSKADLTFPIILVSSQHFVQVHYSNETHRLAVGDSLNRITTPDGSIDIGHEFEQSLGRIIHVLQSHGRTVDPEVWFRRVPTQLDGSNDCGPESLRNCAMAAFGVPEEERDRVALCRSQLRLIRDASTGNDPIKFVADRPENPAAPKCQYPGCKRWGNKCLPGSVWCGEHHPVLQDMQRPKLSCPHRDSKPCTLPSANVVGCKRCWHHSFADDKAAMADYVKRRLRPRQSDPGQEATAATTPAEAPAPRPASDPETKTVYL